MKSFSYWKLLTGNWKLEKRLLFGEVVDFDLPDLRN